MTVFTRTRLLPAALTLALAGGFAGVTATYETVSAAPGGDVRTVDSPLVLHDGDELRDVTVVAAPGYTGDLVVGASADGRNDRIELEDVKLDCNGTAARGLYLSAPNLLHAERVEVTGCQARGELTGAFNLRGNGGATPDQLTQGIVLRDLWAHDNAGNGVHFGHGIRGTVVDGGVYERNGWNGLVVDGSESMLTNVRARGNDRAGVYLRNLIATNASNIQVTGNLHGVRAISLVGASLDVVAQNNQVDLFFDPFLIGGCVGGGGCVSNYGRTRDVVVTGVAGPSKYSFGPYGSRAGEVPFRTATGQIIDRDDLLITTGQ